MLAAGRNPIREEGHNAEVCQVEHDEADVHDVAVVRRVRASEKLRHAGRDRRPCRVPAELPRLLPGDFATVRRILGEDQPDFKAENDGAVTGLGGVVGPYDEAPNESQQ